MTNTASAARTHFAVLCNDTVEVVFPLSDLEALEFHKDFARRRHNTTRKDGSIRQIRITKISAQAAEILSAEFAALAADMKILEDEIAHAAETVRENAGGVTAAISWRDIKWYEARKAKIELARAAVFARYDLVRMPVL
jgi:IS5 family transposase